MDFEWTDKTIFMLRRLWDEGLSVAKISELIGTNKNSVIGKAHRLKLPPRENPITYQRAFTDAQIEELKRLAPGNLSNREIGRQLGFDGGCIGQKYKALGISRPKRAFFYPARSRAPKKPLPVARAKTTGPLKASAYKQAGRSEPCSWPIGMPKTSSFRYCDAPSMQGRPYCEQHFAIAHRDVCTQRQDAA